MRSLTAKERKKTGRPARRSFFQTLLGSAVAASLAKKILAQTSSNGGGIPTRPLGRTGERVSILALGGWHIATAKDKGEAIRIMHAAIDEGITFFDNAWDYHDGRAEEWMGEALASGGRRQQVFLMTKNCNRDYAGSLKCLEDSLRRLRTDHLDLWQFHELVYDNDPDWIFEKGGIKAAFEARKAGKVRFVGFTGHKDPRIHLKMLSQDYPWNASQMPVNVMDAHYRSFQREVVPVCLRNNVGVIGMKGLAGGSPRGRIPTATAITAEECLRYALSLPVASLVVGIRSMEDLRQDVAVARNFRPMADLEKTRLLSRVREEAGDGRHELFKSTQQFDSPHHRRQHDFEV
ncbi:MAG TPA: aldo/keto reductase [Bryobacterales bacterium]|nr:aldo/keto reductase [Bryobacterales bacterium]